MAVRRTITVYRDILKAVAKKFKGEFSEKQISLLYDAMVAYVYNVLMFTECTSFFIYGLGIFYIDHVLIDRVLAYMLSQEEVDVVACRLLYEKKKVLEEEVDGKIEWRLGLVRKTRLSSNKKKSRKQDLQNYYYSKNIQYEF